MTPLPPTVFTVHDDSAVFEDAKPSPAVVTVTMREKTEEKTVKISDDSAGQKPEDDLDSSQVNLKSYVLKLLGFLKHNLVSY